MSAKRPSDSKKINAAVAELTAIAGQKPVITKARKSIATFKLREGMNIGCKVTLRRQRMYEFLDRLITIALPRVRDFRGVSGKSFDGRGNYTLGLKEQLVFPEIDYDKVDKVRGMDIVICTTAKTDAEAKALLKGFQMPFVSLSRRGEDEMAKTSSIERNKKRERLAKKYAAKRAKLKAIADNDSLAMEDRFAARLKLAEMPRNSSKVRIKHRCDLTGRSRSVYRKFRLSRIALRRTGLDRPDPWHGQGKLVRRIGQMPLSDPLGDMLTRIRNAQKAGMTSCTTPASRLRANVLEVLKREGYIRHYSSTQTNPGGADHHRAEVSRGHAGDPRDPSRLEAGPSGLFEDRGPAALLQRARYFDPVDPAGRDVGERRALGQCRRRSAVPRVLRGTRCPA